MANTISDFGEQWRRFPDPPDDHHSSDLLFRDIHNELVDPQLLEGKRVLEVGSGSGRILEMLLRYKPNDLVGLEPSQQAHLLRERFNGFPQVSIVHADGTHQFQGEFDFIFIVGVLHHIQEPSPVLHNLQRLLLHDGTLFVWVYGRENDMESIVKMLSLLRKLTTKVPDFLLEGASAYITVLLGFYWTPVRLSGLHRLPLTAYLEKVFIGCSFRKQVEIVFDQLNPECARFYTEIELVSQLKESGFSHVSVVNCHKYSLSAVAKK